MYSALFAPLALPIWTADKLPFSCRLPEPVYLYARDIIPGDGRQLKRLPRLSKSRSFHAPARLYVDFLSQLLTVKFASFSLSRALGVSNFRRAWSRLLKNFGDVLTANYQRQSGCLERRLRTHNICELSAI